jgi:hypothetical protein
MSCPFIILCLLLHMAGHLLPAPDGRERPGPVP